MSLDIKRIRQLFAYYRYLNYALDSSKIGPEYMYYVMNYIAGSNEMGASIAWNFFQLKFAEISKV